MHHRLAILVFAATALPSLADTKDCSNATTQTEMNACANEAFKRSDAELNAVYGQIKKRLKNDIDATKLLVTAQRAWIAFRDAECTFSASTSAGGSVQPMILSSFCRETRTFKREARDFPGKMGLASARSSAD